MSEGESSSKRRFSLKFSDRDEDQKRLRSEHNHGLRSKDGPLEGDPQEYSERTSQHLSTSASSRFEHSTSAESDCSSGDGDCPSRGPWSQRRKFSQPSWQTREGQPPYHSPPNPYRVSTSTPARMPSPPGFALSSGVPLVNPPAKTQSAFVGKLYTMLEDPEIGSTGLIRWSPDGRIFTCPNPTEFSKTVLPRFFKHNNWQSFVRQLNMYSFNKVSRTDREGRSYWALPDGRQVNDHQATTSDPQAWEFRHPLFRRGEPHLLASIKRKSTKAHASDTTHSPPEDDGKVGVAGWMRDAPVVSSPQHERERDNERERDRERVRAEVYGMNMQTGEMVTARLSDETRREFWDGSTGHVNRVGVASVTRPGGGLLSAPPDMPINKFHPDPNRPPLSAHRFAPNAEFTDSPLHRHFSQHSSFEAMSAQIASLEDRLQRISRVLHCERIERVRSEIDLVSYVSQMIGWVGSGHPPSGPEMHALQETLRRTSAGLVARYEELAGPERFSGMASGGYPPTSSAQNYQHALDHYGRPPPSTSRSAGPPPPLNRPTSHPPPRSSPLPSSTLTDPFRRAFDTPQTGTLPQGMPPPRPPPTPQGSLATIPPPTPAAKSETDERPSTSVSAPVSASASEDSRPRLPGLHSLLN